MMYLNYLQMAIEAALCAGEAILHVYNDPNADFQVEMKADHSPLTVADRMAHQAIAARLECTPFPLLSEEGAHQPFAERAAWRELWVVDPLDGTKEFIKRNGEFTVNIALVREGVPVLGVIYVPVKSRLYFGLEGMGAYRIDALTPAHGLQLDQLVEQGSALPLDGGHQGFVVVASRSHLSPETSQYIDRLRQTHPGLTLASSGSSLKLCLVAEGSADIYPRFAPTMEWDTAAGHALARAAGREVYEVDEVTPLHYNKEDLHNPWFVVK